MSAFKTDYIILFVEFLQVKKQKALALSAFLGEAMKKLRTFAIIAIIAVMLCVTAFASENTVYVSAGGDDTAAGTAEAPLASLYAAFRALPYGGKIIITDATTLESIEFPASNGLITVTSFDGETDYRTSSGGSATVTLGGNVYTQSAVKFENLDITVSVSDVNFICNGNYTCFGEGLTVTKASDDLLYPSINVGATGLVGADGGYVEVHSGDYYRLRGGSRGTNSANHSGDSTIVIYGGNFHDILYLGGNTDIDGSVSLFVYGGTFSAAIVGAATTNISGVLYISIYGGSFASYVRPLTAGNIGGDCTVNVCGGDLATIMGAGEGTIAGTTSVNLASGVEVTTNFTTSTLSSSALASLKTADAAKIEQAAAAKYPANVENPLTSRDSDTAGTAEKITVFKKATAGGDLNGDGKITLIDVLRAIKFLVNDGYIEAADIDEDNKVSIKDTLTIVKQNLGSGEPITEYKVDNIISGDITLYGGASVSEGKIDSGYAFASADGSRYTLYSSVTLEESAVVGLYFGCSDASPKTESGYYFEANTADEKLYVYRIVVGEYRLIAEKNLDLMSSKAQIKVTYGKSSQANAVQLYFNDNPLVNDYYFDFDLALDAAGDAVGLYVENASATLPVVIAESVPAAKTYQNTLITKFTDPEIYYDNGTYYIYGTVSSGLSSVMGYSTTDFVTFTSLGTVLSYTDGFGDKTITAANIVKYGDCYYMFYLQESLDLGYSTTGYATSTTPSGPFVDSEKTPLTSETDLIGGQPFIDDDGTAYLVYTRTTGGNKTYISKLILGDSKAELDLDTETQLLVPTEKWEYTKASVLECGFIVKHEGTYYLYCPLQTEVLNQFLFYDVYFTVFSNKLQGFFV